MRDARKIINPSVNSTQTSEILKLLWRRADTRAECVEQVLHANFLALRS